MIHDNTEHKKMMEEKIKPPKSNKKKTKKEKFELAEAKKRLDNKFLDKPKPKRKKKINKQQEKKVWEEKRKKWYNEKVWRGWREGDKPSEVKTYHISELEKKE